MTSVNESWSHCRERLVAIIGESRFKQTVSRWTHAITSTMRQQKCNLSDAVQSLIEKPGFSQHQIVVLKAVAAELATSKLNH